MLKINGLKAILSSMKKGMPYYKNNLRIQYVDENKHIINFAIVDYRHGRIGSYTYDDWMLYMDKESENIGINLLIRNYGYSEMDIIHNSDEATDLFKSIFSNFDIEKHYETV